ncbi:hypothetical protein NTE_03185 [Candidatus Nitrososphaera evergladensis SR1]|uniref:Uncharacterized protein n=1 Tax=Candidatus Nitrososphaera evergladensis SR1 TaxID=1459636 RepID=A0A075MVE9_9ARCH|nr:hypothetical protein [Candidatus Nitrososphaera evergladensis]AIF85215.1 hypothetical protein NTE_03185 [Candidatus Nitrososphaera evergladensis SR1]
MQDNHRAHAKSGGHEKTGHGMDDGKHGAHGRTMVKNYNINLQSDPATPEAGKPTKLALVVTEQSIGDPITEFDAVHDKLMHLFIVNRNDLSYFAHLHLQLDNSSGIFTVTHTFPESGEYKAWADAKPKGGA